MSMEYIDTVADALLKWDGENVSHIKKLMQEFMDLYNNLDDYDAAGVDKDHIISNLWQISPPDDLADDVEVLAIDKFGRYLTINNRGRIVRCDFGLLTVKRLEAMDDEGVKSWLDGVLPEIDDRQEAEYYQELYELRQKQAGVEEIRKVAVEMISKSPYRYIPYYQMKTIPA